MEIADSGIQGPAYSVIEAELEELARTHSGIAELAYYGLSVEGKKLRGLRISLGPDQLTNPATPGIRPAVIISGATHGNEYLNIEDRLPRWFLENWESSPGVTKFMKAGGVIFIVPIMNPDGYDAR